jgi:hypothetical protein
MRDSRLGSAPSIRRPEHQKRLKVQTLYQKVPVFTGNPYFKTSKGGELNENTDMAEREGCGYAFHALVIYQHVHPEVFELPILQQ